VSASGETIILNDVTSSPLFMPHPLLPDTHAEMTLPLRIGSRIIGVLDIQSQKTHSYAQEDANVLSILTDQIAIAIENARAYELAQKAIEDMREAKSQFLANMSHELRTPLNSIIGFSRVILKGIDGPTTETQQQDLTAIYTSGQHLLLLINDILDLSKIEAGKMDLSFSDVNIAEVTASAMSTAVGLVKDKPIKLSAIMPPDLPVVRADSTRIRQVLINFLSNAAKFTEAGTITVEAFTAKSPQGQPELMVTVTDSGPGIAERDRSKLFLPFSQVDDSPTRKTGGTGLGLSICHSLIEMHNGRIGLLNSEVGKGSTFFFSLPVAVPELAQLGLIESSSPSAALVLSIDDDIQVINLYQRYLQPQGYTVLPLTDPNLAVETARRTQPIAITLDVMMPNRDGWQVMQDLKDDPQTREIPIIVCSLVQEEEKGFKLGATDYLVKPFLQDELLNALQRINQVKGPQQVLVIDDDEDDLRLTEKMLGANPLIHVSLARGGEQGLAMARNTHPNAIILDLMMPGIDGFEVLTQLRADPYLDQIPVIVLSGAYLTLEQHRKLTEIGKQLLTKAYLHEKELLTTLGQALNRIRTV
jgi:signal transduction histidine kinase/CheY-like chemotaxis protein